MARILVLDNYDSFTYNLVQYLGELGAEPIVVRNDSMSVVEFLAIKPDALLGSGNNLRPRRVSPADGVEIVGEMPGIIYHRGWPRVPRVGGLLIGE